MSLTAYPGDPSIENQTSTSLKNQHGIYCLLFRESEGTIYLKHKLHFEKVSCSQFPRIKNTKINIKSYNKTLLNPLGSIFPSITYTNNSYTKLEQELLIPAGPDNHLYAWNRMQPTHAISTTSHFSQHNWTLKIHVNHEHLKIVEENQLGINFSLQQKNLNYFLSLCDNLKKKIISAEISIIKSTYVWFFLIHPLCVLIELRFIRLHWSDDSLKN